MYSYMMIIYMYTLASVSLRRFETHRAVDFEARFAKGQ